MGGLGVVNSGYDCQPHIYNSVLAVVWSLIVTVCSRPACFLVRFQAFTTQKCEVRGADTLRDWKLLIHFIKRYTNLSFKIHRHLIGKRIHPLCDMLIKS